MAMGGEEQVRLCESAWHGSRVLIFRALKTVGITIRAMIGGHRGSGGMSAGGTIDANMTAIAMRAESLCREIGSERKMLRGRGIGM